MNIAFGNNNVSNKRVGTIAGAIISVLVLGFVFFLIYGSYAKPSYTFSGNHLTISGQYGVTINLSEASAVHELSQVPATERKTNGAAIGKVEKGYFRISGSDVYLNVMDENASNYILITDKGGAKYYINCASSDETNNLYNKISEKKDSAK